VNLARNLLNQDSADGMKANGCGRERWTVLDLPTERSQELKELVGKRGH